MSLPLGTRGLRLDVGELLRVGRELKLQELIELVSEIREPWNAAVARKIAASAAKESSSPAAGPTPPVAPIPKPLETSSSAAESGGGCEKQAKKRGEGAVVSQVAK